MDFTNLLSPPLTLDGEESVRCGGIVKQLPSDFCVDELPLYSPCGEGDFLYLHVEKINLSMDELIKFVAKELNIDRQDVSMAGMKDRRAITTQWICVPLSPQLIHDVLDASFDFAHPNLRLLAKNRHTNRLKTGHLQGNRFRITLKEISPHFDDTIKNKLHELSTLGFINLFDNQRFADGRTIQLGLDWLSGRKKLPRRKIKLALSAVQASCFNHWAQARCSDRLERRTIAGDVLAKVENGAIFIAENDGQEDARIRTHEVVVTGPIYGSKKPRSKDMALAREIQILTQLELSPQTFAALGKKAPGARRQLIVWPQNVTCHRSDNELVIGFELPKGAYATRLLRLICGPEITIMR